MGLCFTELLKYPCYDTLTWKYGLLWDIDVWWWYTPWKREAPESNTHTCESPVIPTSPLLHSTLAHTHSSSIPEVHATLTFFFFFRFCWLASCSIPAFRWPREHFCVLLWAKHKNCDAILTLNCTVRTLTFCIFVSLALFVRFLAREKERENQPNRWERGTVEIGQNTLPSASFYFLLFPIYFPFLP